MFSTKKIDVCEGKKVSSKEFYDVKFRWKINRINNKSNKPLPRLARVDAIILSKAILAIEFMNNMILIKICTNTSLIWDMIKFLFTYIIKKS